jgi:glycosyltransferase involved in cell wall biosynthesis
VSARRIIFFAYHYPPSRAVGAIRARKVAEALAAAGHDVHVITLPSGPGEDGAKVDAPGITRHVIVPNRSPRELVLALREKLRPRTPQTAQPGEQGPAHSGHGTVPETSALKRYFFSFLWLPDDVQGFIWPAMKLARRLAAGDGAVLYSTAPPFSPHLAALLAKRFTGAPLILEFRDPWADNRQKPPHVRSQFTDWLDAQLERACLRAADLLISVSSGIDRLLAAKQDRGIRAPRLLIRNGIDTLITPAELPGAPFRILHAGTCSHGRDPRPFLRALAAAVNKADFPIRELEVRFIGECSEYAGQDLRQLANSLGLDGVVHYEAWVPRDEVLRLMSQSQLLLVLAQKQPDQVPNKVYEYLGAGRPILAYADADGEVAALLRGLPGHHVSMADNEVATVDFLAQSLRERRSMLPVDNSRLVELTASRQMELLVKNVERLGTDGSG